MLECALCAVNTTRIYVCKSAMAMKSPDAYVELDMTTSWENNLLSHLTVHNHQYLHPVLNWGIGTFLEELQWSHVTSMHYPYVRMCMDLSYHRICFADICISFCKLKSQFSIQSPLAVIQHIEWPNIKGKCEKHFILISAILSFHLSLVTDV